MNDVYQQMIQTLGNCRRVLLTTHVRPDGDALGSVSALHLALKRKGIDSEILLLSHWPTKYRFLADQLGITAHDAEHAWPAALDLSTFDALLAIDTGTWSQLPGLKDRLTNFAGRKLVLDHHQTQEDWADLKLVVKEAAAAGEIAAELIEQWDIPIDTAIATALFVSITTDTGWFQFSNTRPFTLRLAATLLEAGVDMDAIYQQLYQSERAERVRLQSRAMSSLELLAEGRLAVMMLRKNDFIESAAAVPDTENLINLPMQIKSVEVSMLITEPLDAGPVRVSLRSKGQLDVAQFAEQFGGGGHIRAAGLKLENHTLIAARARVVSTMLTALAAIRKSDVAT